MDGFINCFSGHANCNGGVAGIESATGNSTSFTKFVNIITLNDRNTTVFDSLEIGIWLASFCVVSFLNMGWNFTMTSEAVRMRTQRSCVISAIFDWLRLFVTHFVEFPEPSEALLTTEVCCL